MKVNKEQLIEMYVNNIVHSHEGIKWNDIFEDEVELLDKLAQLSKVKMFDGNPWLNLARNAKENQWKLSKKQIAQIKRNAYLMARLANYNLPEYDHIFA